MGTVPVGPLAETFADFRGDGRGTIRQLAAQRRIDLKASPFQDFRNFIRCRARELQNLQVIEAFDDHDEGSSTNRSDLGLRPRTTGIDQPNDQRSMTQ
jgi:hypothetical protein